jgi:hypothetical protein
MIMTVKKVKNFLSVSFSNTSIIILNKAVIYLMKQSNRSQLLFWCNDVDEKRLRKRKKMI